MKRSNAARGIFWLTIMFAIGFLVQAESGDRRTSMPHTKSAPRAIRILDQNGQPAVNGVAIGYQHDFRCDSGAGFVVFASTVNISVGDTVRWTWAGSGHSVTSGPSCAADSQFCSPNDMNCAAGILSNTGTVYHAHFCAAWHLFLLLRRALLFWHEWRGQCFGWLRAVGMVSGPVLPTSGSDRLAFISKPTGTFMRWAGAPDPAGSDFTHLLHYYPAPTVGPLSRAADPITR